MNTKTLGLGILLIGSTAFGSIDSIDIEKNHVVYHSLYKSHVINMEGKTPDEIAKEKFTPHEIDFLKEMEWRTSRTTCSVGIGTAIFSSFLTCTLWLGWSLLNDKYNLHT